MWGDEVFLEIEGQNKLDCYFQLKEKMCDFAEVFVAAWECLEELLPQTSKEELADKAIFIAGNGLKNDFVWKND